MCIRLFGISKKELLYGIGLSNNSDRENLIKDIESTPTRIKVHEDEIKASNDRLGDIENAPAKIEDDKEKYVTFGKLPDEMILDVDAGGKKGVKCLVGKYKKYYSKRRKQALIDLYLSKGGTPKELKADIRDFCEQFKDYDDVKAFISGVKEESKKCSKKRTIRQIAFACVLGLALLIGVGSIIFSIVSPDSYESNILAAACGGLDLMLGIVFFILERIEDSNEKEREEKISNAQSELFAAVKEAKTAAMLSNEAAQLTRELGKTLSSTTSELKCTLSNTTCINNELKKTISTTSNANTNLGTILQELTKKTEKAKKELEIERENLGICEQCHVPLGQVCNICGHKYSTPLPREEENVYIQKKE